MSDNYREILFRKFEPISGATSETDKGGGIAEVLTMAFTEARRIVDTVEQNAHPYTEEAKAALGQAAAHVEEVASKSSKEARAFLAGFLEEIAKKIKP